MLVRKDSYYDSVFLMLISTDIKKLDGVSEAVVAMGTEMNIDLIADMGLASDEVKNSTANDLIIAIEADSEATVDEAEQTVDTLLRKKSSDEGPAYRPGSLAAAVQMVPGANLAIISLPGQFAAREARKALKSDLHVMLFSDNVSAEDEVALKKLAVQRGLLMMGPDCGTAIINGKPICFANVVPRGDIGIVSASGTGLQEVACVIAKAGEGVSQALGTGGRDLKSEEIGGMMMLQCIAALGADTETKVICVVSKPPLPSLTDRVFDALKATGKPAVVHLVGQAARDPDGNIHFAGNLEEAARIAVAISRGEPVTSGEGIDLDNAEIDAIVDRETANMSGEQKYLRGLFTGGTLTDESALLLDGSLGGIFSFDAKDPAFALKDPHTSQKHTIVDLGEDVFTVGRPHPMIDPSTRTERMDREAEDPEVAVMLLDCVLGYGSHDDPAGAMVANIKSARDKAEARGGYLCVVASVTGTDGDPQGLADQRRKLENAGCVVMPSNVQATMLVKHIMERRASK